MGRKHTYEEVYKIFMDNGYELLEKEYKGNNVKMRYKCPNHQNEETYIRLSDLKNGVKCPFCKGVGKENFDKIKSAFNLKGYELLEDTYINNKTKMAFRCLKHPDEIQYIRYDSFKGRGQGCRFCGVESIKEKTKLSIEFVRNEFSKKGYVLLENEYKNNRQKLRYLCPDHPDKENFTDYSSLQQGHGCPYCAGLKKFEYIEIKTLFEKNNYTLLDTEYKGIGVPMKCYCNHHPNYIQYIRPNTVKRGYKCVYCMGKKATYETSLGFNHPELIEEWCIDKNEITPYEVLPKSNKKVWWVCDKGHEWKTTISNRTYRKTGCPTCNESKGERKIRKYLNDHDFIFEPQKEYDGLKGLGGGNLSFDFYLPNYNLLIEFQGEQHAYYIKGIHGNKKNFKKQQEHDNRKRNFAKENNIKLLEIWYWDFDNVVNILNDHLFVTELNQVV